MDHSLKLLQHNADTTIIINNALIGALYAFPKTQMVTFET